MAFSSSFWGGTQTSKNYQMLTEGATPLARLVDLTGHGMTSFGQELTDPVDVNEVRLERGRIVNRSVRIENAEQTAITFTLLMGNQLWSQLLHRSRRNQTGCQTAIFARRLCEDDASLAHTYIWENVSIDPPSRVNDFIVIDNSTTIAEWQADARASRELILWAIGGYVLSDQTPPLYAITLVPETCGDCVGDSVHQTLYAVGGAGEAADPMIVYKTTDRFSSISTLTTPAPNGTVGTSVYAEGDIVLVGFSDDPDVATGTVGGTVFSTDGGANFTLDSGITEPVFGVGVFNNKYVAVGGTGAGAPLMWASDDGVTWTSVASGAFTGTAALTSMDVDYDNQTMWACGEAGTLYKITASGANFTVINRSSALPGNPGTLNVVRVLSPGRIVVAGAAGYYAESLDGGDTWSEPNVPGSTTIRAVGGSNFRSLVGAATTFYVRDANTDNTYSTKTLEAGVTITGNITSIARPVDDPQDGMNYFAFVTDNGEIGMFYPFYPNA